MREPTRFTAASVLCIIWERETTNMIPVRSNRFENDGRTFRETALQPPIYRMKREIGRLPHFDCAAPWPEPPFLRVRQNGLGRAAAGGRRGKAPEQETALFVCAGAKMLWLLLQFSL